MSLEPNKITKLPYSCLEGLFIRCMQTCGFDLFSNDTGAVDKEIFLDILGGFYYFPSSFIPFELHLRYIEIKPAEALLLASSSVITKPAKLWVSNACVANTARGGRSGATWPIAIA